jgi:hypothetical protein
MSKKPPPRHAVPMVRKFAWQAMQRRMPRDMDICTQRLLRIFIMEAVSDEFILKISEKPGDEVGMQLLQDELQRQAQRVTDIYNRRYGHEGEATE